MKNKIIIYLIFAGLFGVFTSCEKDETKVILSDNPVAPTIVTMPDLTLIRANGSNTLTFVGTSANIGFSASTTYYLDACVSGNNFSDSVVLYSGSQDTLIQVVVSDLNALLLSKFDADAISSADFRIRAVILTGNDPIVVCSGSVTQNITTYGLPRLDLVNSGKIQKIESVLGNGIYTGMVKLNTSIPFTLFDPEANVSYGGSDGMLEENGASFIPTASWWHILTVDVNTQTYTLVPYQIGIVGSATPNGWDTPDTKMEYDLNTGNWIITTTLATGDLKFRLNDSWDWNLGGTPSNLSHNGNNIAVAAGTYTITLTIINATVGSETGTYTIVPVE
jgi:starch-binding outer membrane protein SusE/F